ncbi:MAG: hypothetical protein HGA95_01385 [Caldiserica bacterium]|nr:hypothetical protein [Caldisericota bacterium]
MITACFKRNRKIAAGRQSHILINPCISVRTAGIHSKDAILVPTALSAADRRSFAPSISPTLRGKIIIPVINKIDLPSAEIEKTKQEIIEAMNKIRNRTLEWLNENIEKDLEATYTPRAKKTYACLFYHVAEHEAHHLGQLAMLTTFAGIKTPWV